MASEACSCVKVRLAGRQVGLNWNSDCTEHGTGSEWYTTEGEAKFAATRAQSVDWQRRAVEARQRGMSEITTLDGLTTGQYVVTTYSGTRHYVDLDARTSVRVGAPGREWGDKLFVAHPRASLAGTQIKMAGHYEPVTPDGEPFHFDTIRDAEVGKSMRLDNAAEWRTTSEVRSIERVM